ncbi:PRTRC system protein C [Tellurirhabdus bombi]|uniref:PRTRC system protein C n=1 Tax=Tellurirhabdus bombi TaxID=2907205 RepID=UPI001F48BB71|nr:PRTRC system protein C [Tellurirhabdus bombi]
MLLTTELPREFQIKVKGQIVHLADPGPEMSPDAVLNFYANTYPELTTAKVSGPEIKGDKVEYKFESVMGTKG